jgi:hypothetical protein
VWSGKWTVAVVRDERLLDVCDRGRGQLFVNSVLLRRPGRLCGRKDLVVWSPYRRTYSCRCLRLVVLMLYEVLSCVVCSSKYQLVRPALYQMRYLGQFDKEKGRLEDAWGRRERKAEECHYIILIKGNTMPHGRITRH